MKNKLPQLPQYKVEELNGITSLVSSFKDVEMLILFGSYARGNWVEDKYVEKGITYEYRSDYDILVVLKHEDFSQKFKIEGRFKKELRDTGKVATPVNMIFHGIKHLNKSLSYGNYFFRDIKKEGILLYDSGKHKLAEPKKMTPTESRQKAEEYFDQWFESANHFLDDYVSNLIKNRLPKAAFELHQATERYYTAILLVFTDYRHKDHNIETLGIKVEMCDKRFAVFPKETKQDKDLFEKLKKAYIDARYKMDEYSITRPELEKLAVYVKNLKNKTEEICKEKIKQIGKMV